MRSLTFSFLVLCVGSIAAGLPAFAGDPACSRAPNPLPCNCAAENGGLVRVENGKTIWQSPRTRSPGFQSYLACINAHK
jgi:hypothetical protein